MGRIFLGDLLHLGRRGIVADAEEQSTGRLAQFAGKRVILSHHINKRSAPDVVTWGDAINDNGWIVADGYDVNDSGVNLTLVLVPND